MLPEKASRLGYALLARAPGIKMSLSCVTLLQAYRDFVLYSVDT